MQNSWPLSFMKKRATGPATDPHFANTVLLVGPVDAVGATSVTDESFAAHGSGTSPGINNDAQVTNTQTLFGRQTMRFDSGLNDNFQWADHADWSFDAGLVTLEGFFYLSNAGIVHNLMSQWATGSNMRSWTVQYRGDLGTPTLGLVGSSDGSASSTIAGGNFTATVDTWYYFCYERAASNVHRFYAGPLNGTASMLGKATNSLTYRSSTAALILSGTVNVSSNLHGNLGEIRLTKGVARYDTDSGFAVPTGQFPRS